MNRVSWRETPYTPRATLAAPSAKGRPVSHQCSREPVRFLNRSTRTPADTAAPVSSATTSRKHPAAFASGRGSNSTRAALMISAVTETTAIDATKTQPARR